MDAEREKLLNEIYYQLEMKKAELVHGLFHRIFEVETGFYNGHYHKNADGDYAMDYYPIPVISIKGLCDIEISPDRIGVTAKKKRADALEASYEKFQNNPFEAYGVEDYLNDFRTDGVSIEEMREKIRDSEEREIAFAFSFPFDTAGESFYEFAKLLRREGFYY